MTTEPDLLDCQAMMQTDHKATKMKLFCMKHGTTIFEDSIEHFTIRSNLRDFLRPLWRSRSCKDL